MEITSVSTKNELDALASQGDVVVDFWATWCGPCKNLEPVIKQLAEENPKLQVVKVDVDAAPDVAAAYKVLSMPTVLRISGGEVVGQSVGAMPLPRLKANLGL